MTDDIQLAQLLCSRLCHDLVGPAGAVNAGLELADEGGLDEGTLELMAMSAGEMTNRLSFFRVAFGAAAGKSSTDGMLRMVEVKAVAESLIDHGKAALDWPLDLVGPDALPAGQAKVLLLLILLATESLLRGGQITVRVAELPDGNGLAVSAQGNGVRLKDDVVVAMNTPNPTDLTPRNVHGYYVQRLAVQQGGQVHLAAEHENELQLTALFPKI